MTTSPLSPTAESSRGGGGSYRGYIEKLILVRDNRQALEKARELGRPWATRDALTFCTPRCAWVIDEHRPLAQVTEVIDCLFGDVLGGHLPMKVQIIPFRRG